VLQPHRRRATHSYADRVPVKELPSRATQRHAERTGSSQASQTTKHLARRGVLNVLPFNFVVSRSAFGFAILPPRARPPAHAGRTCERFAPDDMPARTRTSDTTRAGTRRSPPPNTPAREIKRSNGPNIAQHALQYTDSSPSSPLLRSWQNLRHEIASNHRHRPAAFW